MTGKLEGKRCPICGGALEIGLATIPFVLERNRVVVIKEVPAEICTDCHESFVTGTATDQITSLLKQLRDLRSEVSVVAYTEPVVT